jgi:hypothetical protein
VIQVRHHDKTQRLDKMCQVDPRILKQRLGSIGRIIEFARGHPVHFGHQIIVTSRVFTGHDDTRKSGTQRFLRWLIVWRCIDRPHTSVKGPANDFRDWYTFLIWMQLITESSASQNDWR